MIFILTFICMALRRPTILSCARTTTNARLLHVREKRIPLQLGVGCLKTENSSLFL